MVYVLCKPRNEFILHGYERKMIKQNQLVQLKCRSTRRPDFSLEIT